MNPQQQRVARIVLWLVVGLNLWGALPFFRTAQYRPLGPETVSASEPASDDSSSPLLIPVTRISFPTERGRSPFVDTGKRVEVYIRFDYRDAEVRRVPIFTLVVLLVGAGAYWWAGQSATDLTSPMVSGPPPGSASSSPSS